jgi:hypothetical protein
MRSPSSLLRASLELFSATRCCRGRRAHLVAVLLELLLGLVDQALALVLQVDDLAALLVVGGVRLGVALHLLDLVLDRPPAFCTVILFSLPVPRSLALPR